MSSTQTGSTNDDYQLGVEAIDLTQIMSESNNL
ncbi:unnamed protein product, partial [Rotaria sordida]